MMSQQSSASVETTPLIPKFPAVSLSRRNQLFAVIGVAMALLATGNVAGFSAVALPSFLEPTSEIQATAADLSWIASMSNVGCIVGNVMGGLLSDLIGRKRSILFSCLIFFSGWILIARAPGVAAILIGRILNGWAAGLVAPSVQVYICEIAETSIRGASGSVASLTVTIGILSAYSFGSVLEWRTVALTCSIIPIIVLLYVFILLPESPTWLVSKGQDQDAIRALTWLRQSMRKSQEEFEILKNVEKNRKEKKMKHDQSCFKSTFSDSNSTNFFRRRFEWSVVKPFLIGTTLFFLQAFSGIFAISSYTTLIFRYADPFFNEYIQTVCVGVIRLLAIIAAIFLVEIFRRKTLLILSALFMCLANGVLGLHFYLREINGHLTTFVESKAFMMQGNSTTIGHVASGAEGFEWLPLTCILIFMMAYSSGWGIIPWFLVPELMPSDVRSLGCSLVFAMGQIFLFTTVKTFLDLVAWIGAGITFWIYAGVSLASVFFVIFFLPETSNLDDKQIEDIFLVKKS